MTKSVTNYFFLLLYQDINLCHRSHLPSILRNHILYPLVCMSRIIISNCLNNDLFALALRHKLRLLIHPPKTLPYFLVWQDP